MDIIGNAKTMKLLERIIVSGRIANAYLFLGPQGVGKLDSALFFAKKLINNKEKVDANLILLEPETEEKNGITKKKDIKIEAIRELQHKLGLTSMGGEYKAVIINSAERLNMTSQNALLKTLEEPNDKVVLILVSQDEKRILPTIISRCHKIRMGLVGDNEIESMCKSHGKADCAEMVLWSSGRSSVAHSFLADSNELDRRKDLKKSLVSVCSGGIEKKFGLAEKWSKEADSLPEKMNIWIIFLRQVMLGRAVLSGVSPAKALMMIEEMTKSIDRIRQTNANARIILENLFLKI